MSFFASYETTDGMKLYHSFPCKYVCHFASRPSLFSRETRRTSLPGPITSRAINVRAVNTYRRQRCVHERGLARACAHSLRISFIMNRIIVRRADNVKCAEWYKELTSSYLDFEIGDVTYLVTSVTELCYFYELLATFTSINFNLLQEFFVFVPL